ISLVLTFCLVLGLGACGIRSGENEYPANSNPPVGDNTANRDDSSISEEKKPVILAVSFGSSYNETRDITIGAVEGALQAAYPEYEVRRAFTAQTVIDILEDREKLEIDNVTEAMSRLVMDDVKEVVIQPTHVMPGAEYDDIMAEIAVYADQFERFKVGAPLLSEDADYDALIAALAEETAEYNANGTALVFMGHGTHHDANATYATLQEKLVDAGYTNYFVGTVEAVPSLDDVLALVKDSGAKKVVLLPLMIVAGDHATNDMAGDEDGSWKSAFLNAGYEVECILKGLGQYAGVQELIVAHAAAAIASPDPVAASQIKAGTYEINVESSSSMFKIVKCLLTVENGSMNAVITMSGDGYDRLFVGTGEEATAASAEECIQAVLDPEGAVTFSFPVEELNVEMDCTAWSINKEKWYDRTLIFLSDALPADALIEK
ncbi:MAG: sirohydrochlorin cobaltochelatase, partial [Bacillota bacterium]|nr:sirohydrochlorin cobaltochelatase [Bacillota bacterium]